MSSIIEKYSRALKLYRDDGISVPVLPSEMRTLIADFLALKEHCAALESREVCTVAHENVETCGYCQRDALAARLAEVERDAARYRWLRAEHDRIDPMGRVGWKYRCDRNGSCWVDLPNGAVLDDMIDTAMASETVSGEGER